MHLFSFLFQEQVVGKQHLVKDSWSPQLELQGKKWRDFQFISLPGLKESGKHPCIPRNAFWTGFCWNPCQPPNFRAMGQGCVSSISPISFWGTTPSCWYFTHSNTASRNLNSLVFEAQPANYLCSMSALLSRPPVPSESPSSGFSLSQEAKLVEAAAFVRLSHFVCRKRGRQDGLKRRRRGYTSPHYHGYDTWWLIRQITDK